MAGCSTQSNDVYVGDLILSCVSKNPKSVFALCFFLSLAEQKGIRSFHIVRCCLCDSGSGDLDRCTCKSF